jgi:hypothetical protein
MVRCLALACLLAAVGCETYGGGDWKSRVGTYSMDDAIKELGPPDTRATTSDGITVAQWLTSKSRIYGSGARGFGMWSWGGLGADISSSPDSYLQLGFGNDGRLVSWKRIYK